MVDREFEQLYIFFLHPSNVSRFLVRSVFECERVCVCKCVVHFICMCQESALNVATTRNNLVLVWMISRMKERKKTNDSCFFYWRSTLIISRYYLDITHAHNARYTLIYVRMYIRQRRRWRQRRIFEIRRGNSGRAATAAKAAAVSLSHREYKKTKICI